MLSRIFHGENENVAVKRKRQIDTLKIFNDNVVELQEDVEYQVQFDAGETRMAILVSLSPEFPLEKPVLRVSPPIIHPWCNEHSEIISAPGLLNFTVHSDLGRVVQAIIREFTKTPPRLMDDSLILRDLPGRSSPSYALKPYDITAPYYYNLPLQPISSANTTPSIYNYNYANSTNRYSNDPLLQKQFNAPSCTNNSNNPVMNTNNQQFSPQTNILGNVHFFNTNLGPHIQNQPQIKKKHSSEFPELDNLSTEELQKLADDDDRLDEFIESLPPIKKLDTAVDKTINELQEIASSNLLKEDNLKSLKEDITDKIQSFKKEQDRYDKLVQQYKKLTLVFEPHNIRDRLREAADQSQEQSEKIAEDFLNRKIDVERFLSTYVECRKLGQARRTKEEKLAHQLNDLKRSDI